MDMSVESTGNGLAWTDSQGKRHDYEMEGILTLALSMLELRASKEICCHRSDPLDKPLTLRLHGKAMLHDSSVQIIGRPETSSCELSVLFEELTDEDMGRLAGAPHDMPVSLSYIVADSETDSTGNWLVTVRLPPIQFQALNQAYESQLLSRISLGLHLEGLYVREWNGTPPNPIGWFAEPDGDSAKLVIGEMHTLKLEARALSLVTL